MSAVRLAIVAIIALVTVGLSFGSYRSSQANVVTAEWSIFGRANTTSFVAGNVPRPTPGTGYEIVSLAGAGPATALATYVYGGPDLPAALGGPMPPVVGCEASFTLTDMLVEVTNGYPYAGCVFFLGIKNTGSTSLEVSMGALSADAEVHCPVGRDNCRDTDFEVIGGGMTDAVIRANCRAFDSSGQPADNLITASTQSGRPPLTYEVPGTVTWICPLFVVVLQPAAEGAHYEIIIEPPPIDDGGDVPQLLPSPTAVDQARETPVPTAVATGTPAPRPTATPTPIDTVAGANTPGPGVASTPAPPTTGTGLRVEKRSGGPDPLLPAMLIVFGLGLALTVSWPRTR